MDVQSVLIGALLMDDQLAPYSLPELSLTVASFSLDRSLTSFRRTFVSRATCDED